MLCQWKQLSSTWLFACAALPDIACTVMWFCPFFVRSLSHYCGKACTLRRAQHICVCICDSVFVYLSLCISFCESVFVYLSLCICFVNLYLCICLCVFVFVNLYLCICLYVFVFVNLYLCICYDVSLLRAACAPWSARWIFQESVYSDLQWGSGQMIAVLHRGQKLIRQCPNARTTFRKGASLIDFGRVLG